MFSNDCIQTERQSIVSDLCQLYKCFFPHACQFCVTEVLSHESDSTDSIRLQEGVGIMRLVRVVRLRLVTYVTVTKSNA